MHGREEDLPVADLPGLRRVHYGIDNLLALLAHDHDFDDCLVDEVLVRFVKGASRVSFDVSDLNAGSGHRVGGQTPYAVLVQGADDPAEPPRADHGADLVEADVRVQRDRLHGCPLLSPDHGAGATPRSGRSSAGRAAERGRWVKPGRDGGRGRHDDRACAACERR